MMMRYKMYKLNTDQVKWQRGPVKMEAESARRVSMQSAAESVRRATMQSATGFVRRVSVLLAAVLLLCVPVHAAGSIVGGVRMELIPSSEQKTETQKALQYTTEIGFTNRSLLTNDMTYSLVWLIPQDFLPEGNRLYLTADMQIHRSVDFQYYGVIHAKDRFWISRTNNDLKIERQSWNAKKKKYVKAKLNGMVTAKPAGKYWAVKIRKAPFQNVYYPADVWEPARKLNTERRYGISICPILYAGEEATVQQAVSGYVFFDGISLSAAKNLSASFKTFSYVWFDCWQYGSDSPVPKYLKKISY